MLKHASVCMSVQFYNITVNIYFHYGHMKFLTRYKFILMLFKFQTKFYTSECSVYKYMKVENCSYWLNHIQRLQ